MDDWSWEMCPHCMSQGEFSDLTVLQFTNVAVKVCENELCPSRNPEICKINRDYEDAPVPLHLLKLAKLPELLSNEPKMKFRHIRTLVWLTCLRKDSIYLILQSEVNTLSYLVKTNSRHPYVPTPSVQQLLNLTDEEIQVGKYVIPDLCKIVICLRNQVQLYNEFRAQRVV